MQTLYTNNLEETHALGKKIGNLVKENMVILLNGDLGAGKTSLTQGIAKGLGITRNVTSPTFNILKIYYGRMALYHIDAYRLEGLHQELGFDEFLQDDGLTVIEWSEFVPELIPDHYLSISISLCEGDKRQFVFEANGKEYESLFGGNRMLTLCMDTSHVLLVVALIEDDKVIAKTQEYCWKKQSEEIFPALDKLMNEANKKVEDIDSIVITEGPGSYTGVRIAMTIAKVFAATKKIDLYTISTLQLYAGNLSNTLVLLDARGNRVYSAAFDNTKIILPLAIRSVDEAKELSENYEVIGDGHLVNREDNYPDVANNFLLLKDQWKKADNVHLVTPEYLKANEAYLVK